MNLFKAGSKDVYRCSYRCCLLTPLAIWTSILVKLHNHEVFQKTPISKIVNRVKNARLEVFEALDATVNFNVELNHKALSIDRAKYTAADYSSRRTTVEILFFRVGNQAEKRIGIYRMTLFFFVGTHQNYEIKYCFW